VNDAQCAMRKTRCKMVEWNVLDTYHGDKEGISGIVELKTQGRRCACKGYIDDSPSFYVIG
jgi:hypothetical protein